MKSIMALLLFAVLSWPLSARPATDSDIAQVLREMDKRFEQVDKRIEQLRDEINKRFEFMQAIMIALLITAIGSPFLVEYLARRRESKFLDTQIKTEKILAALREAAEKDAVLRRSLQHVGLL